MKIFWALAEKMVGFIPSQRNTQGGRNNATFVRGMFFVVAFALIGISLTLWPLAAIVGLIGLPLPIRHSRKTLWISKAKAKQAPREVPCTEEGSLTYDGRKISLRRGGKVERSLRPTEEPTVIIIQSNPEDTWIGFIPKKDSKRRTIWLNSPGEALPAYIRNKGQFIKDDVILPPLTVPIGPLGHLALCFAELAPLEPDEDWPY